MNLARHAREPKGSHYRRHVVERPWPTHLLSFVGLAAVVLALSWPLPTCFAECLGDSIDPMFSAWNFSWITRSLIDRAGPLFDGNLFYPYRQTLALGEPSLVNGLIALPWIAVTDNPIVGHNLVVIFSLAMAGFGAYLLVWDLTGERAPSLFGGLVFAASPFLIHNAFNIQSLSCYWLPFLWLAIERFRRRATWSGAMLVWTMATLLAVSSVYYTVYGGVILAIVSAANIIVLGDRWTVRHFVKLAVVAPPFIAATLAAYVPYLTWSQAGQASRSIADAAAKSAGWQNFLMTTRTNLLHQRLGWFSEADLATSPLNPGLLAGLFALVGTLAALMSLRSRALTQDDGKQRSIAHVIGATAALVFSLGPIVVVAGRTVSMPYQWLYWLFPPMQALRTPNRFGGPLQLSVAVLAGVGIAVVDRRLREAGATISRGVLWTLAPLLLVVEFATWPFPGATQHYPTPPMAQRAELVKWVRALEGRGAVLELPIPRQGIQLYEAMMHGKPVVHGVSSFDPPLYGEFVNEISRFPSPRAWELLRALPVDFLLLDKGHYSREALDDVATHSDVLSYERDLESHVVFRVRSAHVNVSDLTVVGDVEPPDSRSANLRLTTTIANRTNHELSFYPLQTATVTATAGTSRLPRQRVRLPLWLGAGEMARVAWQLPQSALSGDVTAVDIEVLIASAAGTSRQLTTSVPLGPALAPR